MTLSLAAIIALILLAISVVCAVSNNDFKSPVNWALWSIAAYLILGGVL